MEFPIEKWQLQDQGSSVVGQEPETVWTYWGTLLTPALRREMSVNHCESSLLYIMSSTPARNTQ